MTSAYDFSHKTIDGKDKSLALEVNGERRHPLYAWLTAQPTAPEGPGDVSWNFGKFLIARDGSISARFSPKTAPTDEKLVEAIEAALG
jgi:glutathione peroxidase